MRLAVLCLLLGLAASQAVYQRPVNSDCVTTAVSNPTNFFPGQYQVQGSTNTQTSVQANNVNISFAQGFSVTYFDTYKIVTNSEVNETYVLYQCGLAAPSNALLPPGSKVFSIPLTSVSVADTVPLAFIDLLGVDARLQSASQYATNACGQKLVGCNKVAPNTTALQNTTLLSEEFVPLVDGITLSAANSLAQTFAFTAASDPGVLNRAEWIKFLGLFFNQDALAGTIFATINESYYDIASDIRSTLSSEEEKDPPVMAFVDFYDYGEDEAYEISFAEYKLQYTEAAAAQPLNMMEVAAIAGVMPGSYTPTTLSFGWSNSTPGNFPSQAAAHDAFFSVLSNVDVLIDESYALDPTMYDYSTFLSSFGLTGQEPYPFLQTSRVYREDGLVSQAPNYGLDWFEGAISRPDLVLLDFAAAVRPSEYPGYNATWIRNIAEGVPVQITMPQECSAIPSCSVAPVPICPYVQGCNGGGSKQQASVDSSCVYTACTQ